MSDAPMDWHTLPPRARNMFHLAALARFGLFWVPVTVMGTAALASVWAWTYAMLLGGLWVALQLLLALWLPALAWSRWFYMNIYTASGSGADGVIPGIELADAEALRDRLVRVEGDAGV